MMLNTPKSLRLHIALFGRTNSGKSTLLNAIAGQDVAMTSSQPGTTTDAVEKAMELPPVGPILLIDTAGLDDPTVLGEQRMERARRIFDRADVVLLVTEAGVWGEAEASIAEAASRHGVACIAVVNKCDEKMPDAAFCALLKEKTGFDALILSAKKESRDAILLRLKGALITASPEDFLNPPPLLGDLVRPGDMAVLITPIDKQAPKGRMILPQVQAIRDALDCGAIPVVCRETEYSRVLAGLAAPPALVVCDSQVVPLMVRDTPKEIPCTTFSILFARLKADMQAMAAGAAAIERLTPDSRIMIAEACTHHATEDDIGRVKIPRWIAEKRGFPVAFDVVTGHDSIAEMGKYNLVIHCGSCMLNRRETLRRVTLAQQAGVPITNYGMAISHCRGVLERVLSPFPAALKAYREAR